MIKKLMAVLLAAQLATGGYVLHASINSPVSAAAPATEKEYQIELSRWNIHNDGTHPKETTEGMNKALKWASANGKTSVSLPSGTYMIDKNSRINMVANMTFVLPKDAILQKEANSKERYELLYIGYGVNNVTLKGGTYKGDKAAHDYTKKDHPATAGTHESGFGIMTEGASNVTIDGVKAIDFTGDGLIIGGHGTMVKDLYESQFVQGGLKDNGVNYTDRTKIRTRNPLTFDHAIFQNERQFELSNAVNLPRTFDIFFYTKKGVFVKKLANKKVRELITIPEGAEQFHLVFKQASKKGAFLEFWNRVVSTDVTVKNSEFAFNRRQGITVAGGDKVLIENNTIHDMKGTAPQSGIDLEGGFGENGHRNSNVTIKGNKFYNNAAYDIILYDGRDAIVEDNHLASKGVIGLAVSEPFTGATVKNNHFDGTRIFATHDVTFLNNKMNDSYTTFSGPNIKIDGMTFTDSLFAINAKDDFGISVSNVTMHNTKKSESGLTVWGKPVHIKNLTITGESTLRSVTGGAAEGSIFDNLKVIGFNTTYGLSLPPGTYNNCVFEGAEGGEYGAIGIEQAGKYVFNGCSFKSSKTSKVNVQANHSKLDLTIKNSTFELLGNAQAINIQAAKSVLLEKNTISANHLTIDGIELIRLNGVWKSKDQKQIAKVVIRGNTITANRPAIGISTINAGNGAPSFTIEENTLKNAKISSKKNDAVKNNSIK